MQSSPFSHLNAQQRQAVTAGLGQTLVLAGPGSGKTRVLTERIAYLVRDLAVRPYHILAVTFTNKAAREMQSRVEQTLGDPCRDLWLGTFHSVCARMLRREAAVLPFDSNFVIMDADDQDTLIKRVLKELNINDKLYRASGVHSAISNAKNNLMQPKDYPRRNYRDEVIARVYERYQQMLLQSNALDFDDLLLWTVRLLQENPDVVERYGRRFEHVLVDEFQDTNTAQYLLLKLVSAYHQNLFVVGDEDQSIYRWRGADYRNVLRFEQDFPETQKILLEQNYRSTQTVLDAARAVIDRNPHRTPKHLFTDRGAGDRLVLFEAGDDHLEATYVVDLIGQNMAGDRKAGSRFAVIYRTNAQSRLLEEAFLRSGLPYRLVGAQRFYGRREVKDLICFLRLVANPADEVSLNRTINLPPRGIGDKTIQSLQAAAQRAQTSAGAALLELAAKGERSAAFTALGGRGAAMLLDFARLLAGWMEAARQEPLPSLFDRIVTETRYEAYLRDGTEEGEDRWNNVQELRKLAYEYQDRGLGPFLENLALVSDQDTLPEDVTAPTLLTLHAAKGLEFDNVFIIGLDEGLLPHSRSLDDPEEMAEERRLFYVGMTRARNRLYLVRSRQRSSYGSTEFSEPSRFLQDIPSALLEERGAQRRGRSMRPSEVQASWARWETPVPAPRSPQVIPPPPPAPKVVQQQYRPGMRVRHPIWGEGLVVDSRVLDGEENVDVAFESVGFKRLLASLARLETV